MILVSTISFSFDCLFRRCATTHYEVETSFNTARDNKEMMRPSNTLTLVLLLITLLFESVQCSGGGTYYFFCEISDGPVELLEWNQVTESYFAPEKNEQNEERSIRRRAAVENNAPLVWLDDRDIELFSSGQGKSIQLGHQQDNFSALSNTHTSHRRRTEDNSIKQPESVKTRLCTCTENPSYTETAYYCAADKTYCAVPASYTKTPTPPLCLNLESDEIFARSVWPVVMIWFCLSLLFCVCTSPGRNAVEFMVGTIFPSWSNRTVDLWMQRHPGRVIELWRRHLDRERYLARRSGRSGWFPWVQTGNDRKIEFVLATRKYHCNPSDGGAATTMPHNHDENQNAADEDDAAVTCSICFIPFEEGDRIGKLRCHHLFHSDCIKVYVLNMKSRTALLIPSEGSARILTFIYLLKSCTSVYTCK